MGIDSARLNPWARRARRLLVTHPDVLLVLDRLTRQMRRIAYSINESEPAWSEVVQKQAWALDYARSLEEIGSILAAIAGYLRLPATRQSSDLPSREALSTHMEHLQQQLRSWQARLAQDAKAIESQAENADTAPISVGYRLAIRGAILTDLRRMLDEVHDLAEMTSDPSLNVQVDTR